MKFGLAMFPTESSVSPMDLGRLAEEHDFESLFFPEHTHIPTSRATPYPAGGELPEEYSRTYDPFVSLATVAAVTERLRVATGICLVVERDPITTAKEVATLDVLSGGRVLLGVGAGWNVEEMANHGTDASVRFGLMRERVEAMKVIWSEHAAAYHGRHVNFDPIWAWPKPIQRPHPPILVGGNGRTVLDRVLSFGDEWLPNAVGDVDKLRARMVKLAARARDAGQPPPGVTIYGAPVDADEIEAYARAGATRCVFWLPSAPLADVQPRVKKCAEMITRFAD